MDSDVEMVESTPPAPATPPPSASTADEEARTPNDELPMDVDEPKAEAGETSGFSAAAPKDEVDSANEGSAEPSGDEEAPPVPAWTHAELIALLNAAEDLRLNWSARSKMLYSEFKATRSLEFFSIDECLAKYARLTGESAGKRCGKEMMGWIKTFLKKSVNERHANEEPAKSARVKRLFELTNYSLNGELTDDQLAELIGVDEYYGIAASFDADPTMEDREEWLEADKFSSMLSRDEWKTMKSPDDLLGILRNGTVHDERFWFKHPPEEPEIIERVIEEEAEDLKPSIILPDLVKTADVQVSLVEKKEEKAADVEPTSGEVVKRKRGRPRIHPIEEPPAKQPAPPPPPAAAASPTPAPKVAEPPAALPEPIVLDASRSPSPDVIIYEPDVLKSPTGVVPPASPVRSPAAVQPNAPTVAQPADSKPAEDSDIEIIEPPPKTEKSPAKVERSPPKVVEKSPPKSPPKAAEKTPAKVERPTITTTGGQRLPLLPEFEPETPTDEPPPPPVEEEPPIPKRTRRQQQRQKEAQQEEVAHHEDVKEEKPVTKTPERPAENEKPPQLAAEIKAEHADDAASADVVAEADASKPPRTSQSTQTFLTVHPRRPLQPKRGQQHTSPPAGVRTRRSAPLLSTDKTIEIASAPHSPTPSSAGQPLEFRLRHTQTEPVDVVKLAEVAITYGHSTTLPPIPELQPAAEQTPVKRKESVASTATIATTKPKRRSTMNEKQKAAAAAAEAAEEEQRAKEKKQESPPPQLVPFFVDEHLFHQTMPDVQLVKPEQEDDKESVISTTSRKSAGRRSGRNAKKRGKAGGSEALETPPTTRSKRPTSATTPAPAAPATPQAARLVVPTLGTPGPPQYVSPNQKSLLVTAHNLVIAHPKAAPFTNPVNDDLVADYSKVIKKPIDLETIRKYIDENRIKTLSELNDFYMLMCMNAMNFNDETHTIHQDAFEMRNFCLQTIQSMRHGPTRNAARATGRKSAFGRELETPTRGAEHSGVGRPRLFRTAGAHSTAVRKVYVRTGNYPTLRKVQVP